ncbi:MAG: hypothetical protein Q4C31_08635 [Eubacteriales bacterium]|nr:hypothetical protein [Eubacteriales bacterium]
MMKRFIAVLLCALMLFSGSALAEIANAVNPLTPCASLKEAARIAGFSIDAPEKAEGCTVAIQAWKNNLIEICYDNGKNTLTVRKARGEADVSGDFTDYPNTAVYWLNGVTVTLKGDSSALRLITWTYQGYSYSLSCSTGMDSARALRAMQRLCGVKPSAKDSKSRLFEALNAWGREK